MSKYTDTMRIIKAVREKTDTAVLFYSAGGKDGIALLDMLAGVFDRVICYYMYHIKGLRHIQPYIKWAETHYNNVEVRQIRHWGMDNILKNGFFCDPDPTITKVRKIGEQEEEVRQETGIKYAFSGMKGTDGYMKRMRLKMYAKTGYITEKGMVYPIALWTNAEILKYIRINNLIEPFVYKDGAVSQGFAIDMATMNCLRERFPEDYKKMMEAFPYIEIQNFKDYSTKR